MFYLGGVALSFFLTLLLLSKKNKSLADKILSAWLVVITLHLLSFYFGKQKLYPELLAADMPLPLLHGPFLYLYVIALTRNKLSTWISLLHFVPAVLVLLYLIPFFALPVEKKIYVFEHEGEGYEMFILNRLIAVMASGIFYVTLSAFALHQHRKSIVQEFSSTEKINLQWLQYLIYWIGAIWILVIVGNDDLVFGAAVLFVLFIGFFGIRQVGIFHSTPESVTREQKEVSTDTDDANASASSSPEKKKYSKSGLNSDSAENLHRQLTSVMTNEKLFRESELSLTELAKRLDAPANYLSQVINEREGKNFYDYINSLRIEEFKRIAASPDSRKYTLLGLAEECGFNSKSSFNRYFKKSTGKSPSEFLQEVSHTEN